MKLNYKYITLLFVFITLWGCSDDDQLAIPYIDESDNGGTPPTPTFTGGSADFSTYVAVGNSLTAGYSDGALFAKGQEVSFPNILGSLFTLAGGGEFTQPLMNDDMGGLLLGGTQITGNRLIFDTTNQVPVPVPGMPTTEITTPFTGPFNNMGVPGAKSYHLIAPGYGNVQGIAAGLANPYFARMASDPDTSVLADVLAQNPTFFSLWIGSNDVLGYATSGGVGEDHNATGNLDATTYGSNDITNSNVFAQIYDGILTQLTLSGAEGIVANLPSVTSAPYFTAVPYNPIPMDGPTAGFVNGAYSDYNNGLLQAESFMLISAEEREARTIHFMEGSSNPVVIEDEYLTDLSALGLPSYRHATANDLVVLPAQGIIGTLADPSNPASVNGVGVPLADMWVLLPEEQMAIEQATVAFNSTIESLAAKYDLPFLDANGLLEKVANGGVAAGAVTITNDYVTGGAFSLDGVHPSPRGYAVIANAMIDLINAKYGSNIPKVDPVEFTGVYID